MYMVVMIGVFCFIRINVLMFVVIFVLPNTCNVYDLSFTAIVTKMISDVLIV